MRDRIKNSVRIGEYESLVGKSLSEKEVDAMDFEKLEKNYERNENILTRQMTDSLGKNFTGFYSDIVGKRILGIESDGLKCDLEKDPFTNALLRRFTCDLYFCFGEYLARVTIGAITMKHYLEDLSLKNS